MRLSLEMSALQSDLPAARAYETLAKTMQCGWWNPSQVSCPSSSSCVFPPISAPDAHIALGGVRELPVHLTTLTVQRNLSLSFPFWLHWTKCYKVTHCSFLLRDRQRDMDGAEGAVPGPSELQEAPGVREACGTLDSCPLSQTEVTGPGGPGTPHAA